MTLETTKWKIIEDYPDFAVSTDGQVKNIKTGRLRRIRLDYHGYCVVCLDYKRKQKEFKVHRLVALAFIPNPENKPAVNHKNGIKTDNTLENLEWNTASENNYHAWNTLDSSKRRKSAAERAHKRVWSKETREKISNNKAGKRLSLEACKHISESHKKPRPYMRKKIVCIETGVAYLGIRNAAEKMGCSRTGIANVLSGRANTSGGYHWKRGD